MRQLSLTIPSEIIDELELLCNLNPRFCKKQSKLGWNTNERYILVREKYFQYYNLHQGFKDGQIATIKKKYFKGSVRLDFIHEINYLPKNKIKKNNLQIIFPGKKLLTKLQNEGNSNIEGDEENRANREINKAEDNEMIRWLFQFDYDIKEYVEGLKEKRKEEKKQLNKIQGIDNYQLEEGSEANNLRKISFQVSKQDHTIENQSEHQKNIEDYVNSIQKTKNYLKAKTELEEEEAMRIKKKREKEMMENQSFKYQNETEEVFAISSFWREYYKSYEMLIKKEQISNNMQGSQIDPKSPTHPNHPESILRKKLQNELNVLSQLEYFNTTSLNVVKSFIDEKIIGFQSEKLNFENFVYHQGVWLKIGGKELNQEFLANYYLNDIIYSLKDFKSFKIRIPAMILCEYRGFKVLCMCDLPFSQIEKSEIYNLYSDQCDLQLMAKLKEVFQNYEDVLNIKNEALDVDSKKKIAAPLGNKLRVFEYSAKKDKKEDQSMLPNFYYLVNIGKIFPIDFNFQQGETSIHACLRPELVAMYRDYCEDADTQLLSQAFLHSNLIPEIKQHEDLKVLKASNLIINIKIPEIIEKLNNLQMIWVDSLSIKMSLEENGVNIRYLYMIYEKVNLPYIRELILVEVIARTIKKEFRTILKESYEMDRYEKEGSSPTFSNANDKRKYIEDKVEEIEVHYSSIVIDYLNLIFGVDSESMAYMEIIKEKCEKYYRIQVELPLQLKGGCLLNALLYHCNISLPFNKNISLFQHPYSFPSKTIVTFQAKYKSFDFPSFQIQKQFRMAPEVESEQANEIFKQASMKLLKLELLFNRTLHLYKYQTQITLSKLNNFDTWLEKPNFDSKLHPAEVPYYIANKSPYNFERALDILNFALPDNHPLYITLYIEYSQIMEPQLLKKTALLIAVRGLGEFHFKTTQIYSKLYNDGIIEYQDKAKRVKSIEACLVLSTEMYQSKMYQSCLNYCLEQIAKLKDKNHKEKIGTSNYEKYLDLLFQGLDSSIKTTDLDKGIQVSKEISNVMSSFKTQQLFYSEILILKTLIIHLLRSKEKYFLYKMVLLVVYVRKQFEEVKFNEDDCSCPCGIEEKQKIVKLLLNEYYEYESHSNWIAHILNHLLRSFKYFNFLDDLFNNFDHHLKKYNSDEFKTCLMYWDILVRLYGQALFKEMLYDVRLH